MTSTLVEAFELLVNAEQLEPRLEAAAAALSQLPGLTEEKAWLAAARERLESARPKNTGDLLNRVLRIPELEGVKGDRARLLQGAIVDALERLHAGISFAGGNRAPLLDALYHNVKVPQLRKCGRDELERFCVDLEKRMASSYARRMFANETYSVVTPALEELRAAIATWRSVFVAPPLGEAESKPLRDELDAAGRRLEVAFRQARLLAQAALLPTADLLDAAGLTPKAKRRAKDPDEDTHPLLENDPPDPTLPSPEERAEIAAAHALS
jgi:hypothetical protein